MPRFLIEVPHDPQPLACARVVKIFQTSGSHLLTHADWGCMDGVHSAWMIVDVADRNEAMGIIPPALRPEAKVVGLNSFSTELIDTILKGHDAADG